MILMYHKVYPESPTMWWVTPNAFWDQMESLKRYDVLHLDDYDPSNPKHAVITFDGVYENVYTYAFPILKKFGYPFELFIVGSTIGKGNEFDQPAEPPARFADFEQLKVMSKNGGRLQWHSMSHTDLSKVKDANIIRDEFSVPENIKSLDPDGFKWFAYPHGRHTPELIETAKKYFKGGISCIEGNNHDRYQLNRITVTNDTTFKQSTVSLIIPNYNYGRFAAEAIESALLQTVQPDEILFIDDCSDDNSMKVAEQYKDKIKIVRNEKNLGIVANFNKAVSLTKGNYICLLGADNRFRSDYVEKCKFALDTHPDVAIVYTNVFLFGPFAEIWAKRFGAKPLPGNEEFFLWEFPEFSEEVRRNLRRQNVMHGSSMYRRAAFEEVGGYLESKAPEDQNLFARILEKGWNAIRCPEYLLEYRHHSNKQDCTQRIFAMEFANIRKQLQERDAYITKLTSQINSYQKMLERNQVHPVKTSHCLIAFYLPQFHPIPENDEWWGKDFTDWVNVAKAMPQFPGHYQPRIPADLGYYDLRLPEVRQAQANLAREYGIYGFCYYHYWFNGKLLLESPLHEVLNSGKPDFPFCLCWANEDWTRAWDGRSGDILIQQDYTEDDDLEHIRYLCKFFHDKRYIRINGKPLFLVYRASKIPVPRKTTAIWREEARKLGVGEVYLCRVESFPDEHTDPTVIGFDAAVEFQPDWTELGDKLSNGIYGDHEVFSYDQIVERMLKKIKPPYKRFPCVTPTWDNSPRRKSNAYIFIDSTPQVYERWLKETIRNFKIYSPEENFIFINAWNEWGESNYLEPDLKFGKAYLEATKNALLDSTSGLENTIVSFKGEDFSPSALVKIGRLCYSLEFNDHAKYFFDKALKLDPSNEDAKANLAILRDEKIEEELNMPLPIAVQDNFSIIKVASYESYNKYISNMQFEYNQRLQYERSLIKDSKPFTVDGHCYVCDQKVDFSVDYQYSSEVNGVLTPNWRERLVCPTCGLNNRMRASIHLFEQVLKTDRKESKLYITEQVSPVYNWLKKNYENVVGSEYLGDAILFGTTSSKGI